MRLGEIIKSFRVEHNMTQQKFADLCSVSKSYISLLENGKTSRSNTESVPSIDVVSRFAKTMGISVDELLRHVDPDQPISLKTKAPEFKNEILDAGFPYHPTHRIPILGRISAGKPLFAEEHIEGYTYTELNGGGEYFALRVVGDSMNAARINDGDLLIVRQQEEVENGQIAVVMVDSQDATVKKYYRNGDSVSLVPQSFNPKHEMQVYDLHSTAIKVLGLVVQNVIKL